MKDYLRIGLLILKVGSFWRGISSETDAQQEKIFFSAAVLRIPIRIRIRIHRIHMFLGLQDPDPDPLIRGMDPDPDPALDPDPDPSIIMQKTLIPTILWLFLNFYLWKMM